MKARLGITLAAIALFLGGCVTAPQTPVSLSPTTFADKTTKIGVVMTALPKVDTFFPGAGCLLCYAAASATNSTLTTHTQTLTHEDLPKLKDYVADVLRKKGHAVTVIAENINLQSLASYDAKTPNVARQNFMPLRQKYNVEKLVVIDITLLGMVRNYSSYFPTGDPKATLQGTGFLVNLSTNTYEWYSPILISKSADKTWDEPPKFPGLTNAYFQVVEMGKDKFIEPFAK